MSFVSTKPPKQSTCATHGSFEARHILGDIWAQCPRCTEIELEAARKREEDLAASSFRSRVRSSGVPERFFDRSLENYLAESSEQRRALEFACEYVANFDEIVKTGRSAMFLGRPGTGKTHLACGMISSILKQERRTAIFTTVQRAMRRIKDSWNKSSDETESDAILAFTGPDLLVLDEVGVQFGSEFEKQTMFDILNERYERRRPVLLLSNLDLKEVSACLGERIMDRLREDGGRVIVFTWESYRKKT